MKNKFQRKIQTFQTYGGREYINNNFKSYLEKHGIHHQYTCPHHPGQNGMAKQKHCHLVETSLTLLAYASMPQTYWVEALHTANFLINQLPTKVLNLRKRMVSPLPASTLGNLVWAFPVLIEESDRKLHEVVVKLRKSLTNFCNDKANRFKGKDGFAVVSEYHTKEVEFSSKGVNIFRCTSLCKFPIYDMDFGWGKPTWVATTMGFKNFIVLIDSKLGENIEAWVTLAEQEMAIFHRDEMLLSFASLNPSAAVHESRK